MEAVEEGGGGGEHVEEEVGDVCVDKEGSGKERQDDLILPCAWTLNSNWCNFSRRLLFLRSRYFMKSTALNNTVLFELLMFFRVGMMSVKSLNPVLIVLRRFCSEAM